MNVLKRVIYLLLLTCAACNLSQQDISVVTPIVPTDAPTPTSEIALATYNNTAYGYSIQFPEGLTLDGSADSQFVWLGDQIYIMVSDIDPEQPMGDAPVIESAQDTMIGMNTARRLSGYIGAVGGNTPQRYESFVVVNNGRYYQFIAYELKRGDVQPIDRTMDAVPPTIATLLEQVVASLRFAS